MRPNTLTSWWSAGTAPDLASLLRVANAMGRPLAALVDAYQGREVEPDTEADLAAAITPPGSARSPDRDEAHRDFGC
jgi:hypothetical protein